MAKPDDTPSMAVFCDFENVALGVRDAKYEKFDIRKVLERLLLKGSIVVKKAYCDWDRYREFKAPMHEASFELIEIPHVRQSGKNSADIRMVVDALDLCYTKSHVDTFVIISGDSDFSPLVSKLRENAKTVIGVGVKGSTSDLLTANCDEFIFYDDLVREQRRRRAQREGGARGEGARGETARAEPARGEARPEAGRGGAGRGGARGSGRGSERDGNREPSRAPAAEAADALAAAEPAQAAPEASPTVGGPWRPYGADAGRAAAAASSAAGPAEPAPEEAAESPAEPAPAAADAPKKRPPRRRKAAAATEPAEDATPARGVAAGAADATAAQALAADALAGAEADATAPAEPAVAEARPPRSDDERRQEAIDLAVETVEALITERGADDKIWGSMVKQTLKRRRPGFAESYYGYRSFNELLEDARDRGLLALEHDEKSGGYVIRLL